MSSNGKGLSWIDETAQGFLGKPVKFSQTGEGQAKASFDLGCGVDKPDNLQFAIWRHCIAYGSLAEMMQLARMGNLIRVEGFLVRQARRDNQGKIMYENRTVVTIDRLIVNRDLRIIPKSEYKSDKQLLFQVDTAEKGDAVGAETH